MKKKKKLLRHSTSVYLTSELFYIAFCMTDSVTVRGRYKYRFIQGLFQSCYLQLSSYSGCIIGV
jgi:hypothetical protein